MDSAGAETPVTVTWSGFAFNYSNYTNGRDDGGGFTSGPNGDGYFGGGADRGTVTLSGLNAGTLYDIVTIGAGDPVKFTIGQEARDMALWHSTNNPSNWTVFTGVAPDGPGRIRLTVSTANGGNFGIGGIQLTPRGPAVDTDGDGMTDAWEDANSLNKASAADAGADADQDGLTNLREYQRGTDPQNPDTDGDELTDGVETGTGIWAGLADTGTDPLRADSDGDSLPDAEENFSLPDGTDPNRRDTDGDGFGDATEIAGETDPRDPLSSARTVVPGLLINVDFNSTPQAPGAGGLTDPITFDGNVTFNEPTAYSVPFVDANAAVNDVWNGFEELNLTDQPLVDSAGAATDARLSWSGFDMVYTNYLNGQGAARTNGPNGDGHLLLNGGAARSGTVIVSGLNAATYYDVAAIGGGSDPVSFTVGSATQQTGEWNSVTNPANLAVFQNVVPDSTGRIIVTVSTNGSANFGIGGVQVAARGSIFDTDSDGMPDAWEEANGLDKASAADAGADADQDGLTNLREYQRGTNPRKPDTDDDTLNDGVETGTGVWVSSGDTGTDPLKMDTDGDGLADAEENLSLPNGSDPNKKDTDGDGLLDPVEIAKGSNPKDAASTPRQAVAGTLINIDFNGDVGGAAPLPVPVTFDGNLEQEGPTAGSVAFEDNDASVNDVWNGWEDAESWDVLKEQPLALTDSKGAATAVTVTWTGFGFNYSNYTNGRDSGGGFTHGPNGDGFYAAGAAQPVVTVNGLNPAAAYDIAALAAGDPVKFTLGEETFDIPIWHSTLNPANWMVFQNVSPDATGAVVLTVASINGTTNFGIGGLQISGPSGSPPAAARFSITGFSRNPATGEITLTWESSADKTYTVSWGTDPAAFPGTVTGLENLPGAAGSMTRSFAAPAANAPRLFFRVRAQ